MQIKPFYFNNVHILIILVKHYIIITQLMYIIYFIFNHIHYLLINVNNKMRLFTYNMNKHRIRELNSMLVKKLSGTVFNSVFQNRRLQITVPDRESDFPKSDIFLRLGKVEVPKRKNPDSSTDEPGFCISP